MFTYTVNPAETEVTIDPNLVLGKGPVRFQFKDEHGNFTGFTEPAITIESNLSMTDNDIYNLGGEAVEVSGCIGNPISIQVTGPGVVVEGSNAMYAATGAYANNCTQDVTSQCTWTATGGIVNNGAFSSTATGTAIISCATPNMIIGYTNPPVAVISELEATCLGDDFLLGGTGSAKDRGFWDGPNDACWVLGESAKNCTDTCDNKLPPNVADCDINNATWNDDNACNVCTALTGVVPCTQDISVQAPFLYNGSLCRYRASSNASCSAMPASLQQRICACVAQP